MSAVFSFLFGGGDTTTKQYQRLGELQRQTAKEAEPRPIVWGRVRPISGNIMHASKPRKEMVEVGRTTVGGKGAPEQTTVSYQERVFRTYAIRICEGPITGVVRVWKNDKLVYDARGNDWGDENNEVFLAYAKFYLGDWDQMPDPVLEAIWGVGEVPAYRGTCYMRIDDEDVTDFGGRVPNYVFEVQREQVETVFTSKPYAIEVDERFDSLGGGAREAPSYGYREQMAATGGALVSGDFGSNVVGFDTMEEMAATGGALVSGELDKKVKLYDDWPFEQLMATGGALVSGELDSNVISYDNWPMESFNATGGALVSGGD